MCVCVQLAIRQHEKVSFFVTVKFRFLSFVDHSRNEKIFLYFLFFACVVKISLRWIGRMMKKILIFFGRSYWCFTFHFLSSFQPQFEINSKTDCREFSICEMVQKQVKSFLLLSGKSDTYFTISSEKKLLFNYSQEKLFLSHFLDQPFLCLVFKIFRQLIMTILWRWLYYAEK